MSDQQGSKPVMKAQLLRDSDDLPIQLVLPASAAADLAFIASDFAREVLPDNDEARRLIKLAEMISIKLEDCLAARSVMVGPDEEEKLALAG